MLYNPAWDRNVNGPQMKTDDIVSSIRLPTPLQKPNNFPNQTFS
jgi:hypothetical protein